MEKIAIKIKVDLDNKKTATLSLTESEVITGDSICKKNAINSVIVMKKHNGCALFFTNEAHAANAQQRHNFEYAFDVTAEQLAEKAEAIEKAQKQKETKQTGGN